MPNLGRYKRCNQINTMASTFINDFNLDATRTSYLHTYTPTIIAYHVNAIIPLWVLSPFFASLGVVKGAQVEIYLTMNTGTVDLNIAAGGTQFTTTASSFNQNNACPFQVSSPVSGGLKLGALITKITASAKIGFSSNSPLLVVKKVEFTPEQDQAFIARPDKRLIYTDHIALMSPIVASGANLDMFQVISNLSRARYLVIMPLTDKGALSPLSSTGGLTTAPYAKFTNLMVYQSGDALFQQPLNYDYQTFNHNLLNIMSENGANMKVGNNISGLITKEMYSSNYHYNVVDLTIGKASDHNDAQGHNYSVNLTNNSLLPIKYLCMIFFEKSLLINRINSAITAN
jgi:hypothetical protein